MATAAATLRTKVLVIEDENRIGALVARTLEGSGYEVTTVGTGLAGLRCLSTTPFGLVILDLLLPDLDGFETLQSIRERVPGQQVLVLSAVSDVKSKVRCLELGACDYLGKPFDLDELVARVRVRLGDRNGGPRYVRGGALTLDLHRRVVACNRRTVTLTSRECVLLEFLMRKKGDVATRHDLLEEVWGPSFNSGTNVVDVCIARLRQKLGDQCIETVRNVGYCFVDA